MAAWPYNTTAWRKLRLAKLGVEPLCEVCRQRGRINPANHVDHIQSIASGGDPFPPLPDLRSLCASCHSIKTAALDRSGGSGVGIAGCGVDGLPLDASHPFIVGARPKLPTRPGGLRYSRPPLTIVCGPPASGKSSFVAEHAASDDVVIDLDMIASRLARSTLHGWGRSWLRAAVEERNRQLLGLGASNAPAAWFIIGQPEAPLRQWWCDQLNPRRVVVLETPAAVCVRRIHADPDRRARLRPAITAVERWWQAYGRRRGDEIMRLTHAAQG